MDVGSSSEVHQAGKGGKDVLRKEKNIICIHVFNCPIMLCARNTIYKMAGISYPIFFNSLFLPLSLIFSIPYSFWVLEKIEQREGG